MKLDAAERVQLAARLAVEKHTSDFEKALAAFERAVADDAEALREILAPYWKGAAGVLLRREAAMIRSKAGNHVRAAMAGSQTTDETQSARASGHSSHSRRAGANATAGLSIFDSFITELNRPLGDMTKEELQGLRDRNAARCRLYDYLQQPLPPRGIVREHFTTDDVTAWLKVQMPYLLPVAA